MASSCRDTRTSTRAGPSCSSASVIIGRTCSSREQSCRRISMVRRFSSFAYRQQERYGLFSYFGATRTNAPISKYNSEFSIFYEYLCDAQARNAAGEAVVIVHAVLAINSVRGRGSRRNPLAGGADGADGCHRAG
jgi:hypothetical protein